MKPTIRTRWTAAALLTVCAMPAAMAAKPKSSRKPAPRPAAKKTTAPARAAAPKTSTVSAVDPTQGLDNWPMFRGNPAHTAFTPVKVSVPLSLSWTWTGEADSIVSSPAVSGGSVYIGLRDTKARGGSKGGIVSIDLATGKSQWTYRMSDKSKTILTHTAQAPQGPVGLAPDAIDLVESSPAVAGGVVYFTSRDGALHAVGTNGALKWRLKTGGTDTSSPCVANGTVYFGSGYPNKDFWAVNAASGVVKWRTNSGIAGNETRPGQFVYSSPAFADNTLYAAADDGGFYSLNPTSGKVNWRYETAGGIFFHSPTVAGPYLIGAPGDFDVSVYAIDRTNGKMAWKYDPKPDFGYQRSYISSPAYDGKRVYIGLGTPDQRIVALDATTGKKAWDYVTGWSTDQSYTSSPAVTSNLVIVGGAQAKQGDKPSGRLIALDKETGKQVWDYTLPAPVISSPAVAGNYVIVGCLDGAVYAFRFTGT